MQALCFAGCEEAPVVAACCSGEGERLSWGDAVHGGQSCDVAGSQRVHRPFIAFEMVAKPVGEFSTQAGQGFERHHEVKSTSRVLEVAFGTPHEYGQLEGILGV